MKSNEGVISNFVEKVSLREIQLEYQKGKTKNYETTLGEFESQIKTRIEMAKDLIQKSEEVLELKKTEGISKGFNTQYKEPNNKWVFAGWLLFSLVFLSVAVIIGWLILSADSQDLLTVIARISLLPILLTGAYFTANQYIKQKNIAEDYAYKQALSKFLIGFPREILKQGGNQNPEYSKFVTKIFDQMLQDPLRNRKEKLLKFEPKKEHIVDIVVKVLNETDKVKK